MVSVSLECYRKDCTKVGDRLSVQKEFLPPISILQQSERWSGGDLLSRVSSAKVEKTGWSFPRVLNLSPAIECKAERATHLRELVLVDDVVGEQLVVEPRRLDSVS